VQSFQERAVAPAEISLSYALLGGEPWTEAMRREIDAGLGVQSTNIFGLSEVIGPGVSCECVEERAGAHVNEDHFLPEVVDPETGEPLAEGEEGVLVFLADELDHVGELRARTEGRLRESIGCSLTVRLEAPGTVPRSEGGKLQRVLDRRELEG